MGINSAIKIKYIKFISACVTSLLISISLYGQNDVTNVIIIISDDLNDSVEGMGVSSLLQAVKSIVFRIQSIIFFS